MTSCKSVCTPLNALLYHLQTAVILPFWASCVISLALYAIVHAVACANLNRKQCAR